MNNYDEIHNYIVNWAQTTEKIVGAALKKQGVVISEPSEKNIVIDVFKRSLSNIGIKISTRDALHFVDMGAGSGYRKGVRITQREYRKMIAKPRVKKPVFNRPIFKSIAYLQEVVAASVIQSAMSELIPNQS